MSLFFKESSQVSEYQNTAFFQNGEASKTSIFDNPPQSETQLAFELFNIDSVEPNQNNKERSIISKLDLIDREREEFTQNPMSSDPEPQNKRDNYVQSQESRESRMTFGWKLQNNLRKSKAEEGPRSIEDRKELPKPMTFLGAAQKSNQPSNNLLIYRQANRTKEPESMPVKFEESKPTLPPKTIYEAPSNSSSSSFSIDFEQIKQRNQVQIKPMVKQVVSLKFNNHIQKEIKDCKSESGKSQRIQEKCSSQYRLDTKDSQKEKKFGFTLRRSKVSEENKDNKGQSNFLSKINTSNTSTTLTTSHSPINRLQPKIEHQAKNEEKFMNADQSTVTPFKIRTTKEMVKDLPTEKVIISSNVKRVDQDRKSLFNRNTLQQKNSNADAQIGSKTKYIDKDIRKTVEIRPRQEKLIEDSSIQKPALNKNDSSDTLSEKRESIGLKEQLKKLTSRPTQKVELKSIAFNKGFKFKTKPIDDKNIKKTDDTIVPKENGSGIMIQMPVEIDQKPNSKSFINLKEDKTEFTPVRSIKPTEFSKYMLTLMELQQECEMLRGKSIRSRNSYRELAIFNDDINRRIDQVLRNKTKR